MKQMVKKLPRYLIAGGVAAAALLWNGNIPTGLPSTPKDDGAAIGPTPISG